MPYCANCGRRYEVGTRFCSNCGKPLNNRYETLGSEGEPKKRRLQERDKRCPYCNSMGKVDGPIGGDITETCPVCKGRRYNLIPEDWLKCSECSSTGEFTYGSGIAYTRKPCPECKGTGWAESGVGR
jgi:hypothetical protein